MKKNLISLIENSRIEDDFVYLSEDDLDQFSIENNIQNSDNQYDLNTIQEILKDEYIVELYQETEFSDFEVQFKKIKRG